MRRRRWRIDKEQFTEFLAGAAALIMVEACWIAFLLKL